LLEENRRAVQRIGRPRPSVLPGFSNFNVLFEKRKK